MDNPSEESEKKLLEEFIDSAELDQLEETADKFNVFAALDWDSIYLLRKPVLRPTRITYRSADTFED